MMQKYHKKFLAEFSQSKNPVVLVKPQINENDFYKQVREFMDKNLCEIFAIPKELLERNRHESR